jgi:hypothetical protein
MTIRCVTALGLILLASGCCKEDRQEPLPFADPAVANTAVPLTESTAAAPAGMGTDPNRPGRGLDGLPAVIPAPSSPPPTIAEWDGAPWEITVSRSTPLGCETKMVREWLRVSCRDENKDGGKILGLSIVQKGGVQAYVYERKGVASLVVQVVKGKKHVTQFRWTDRTQKLVVDWTHLGTRPKIDFTD